MTDHQHTADVLNRAADAIERDGWTRGCGWPGAEAEGDPSGLCLEGAIMAASGLTFADYDKFSACPAYRAVRSYLTRIPYCWNDERGRTASEVIETLRAAAAIEQAKHDAEQPATVALGA